MDDIRIKSNYIQILKKINIKLGVGVLTCRQPTLRHLLQ